MTEIIKPDKIDKAIFALRHGGLIIYPTETCYGIGADITNKEAVRKITILKQRSEAKKLSAVVSDIEMAKGYGKLTKIDEKIVNKFMPGPLTLIVKKNALLVPDEFDSTEFAFRIPNNRIALEIVNRLGKPIVATSANISGQDSLYNIDVVKKIFDGKVDVIIDGGNLPIRKTTTVIDLFDNQLHIRREGSVSEKDIRKVLKD